MVIFLLETGVVTFILATSEQTDEIFDCDFFSSKINFNVIPIQVDEFIFVVVDCANIGISSVACHVISEKEHDLRILDSR